MGKAFRPHRHITKRAGHLQEGDTIQYETMWGTITRVVSGVKRTGGYNVQVSFKDGQGPKGFLDQDLLPVIEYESLHDE